MSGLFLVPVDDSWLDRFEETVSRPVNLESSEAPEVLGDKRKARIWGQNDEGQKRAFFEKMEEGDPVLFYNNMDFFSVGRVGETFESSEVGKWLWDEPNSKFIFTITNYHDTGPSLKEVNRVLGYKESNIVYGFNRPSEEALNNLLQKYNSIEEAFQDFKSADEDRLDESSSESTDSTNDSSDHTEIQWHLIKLGQSQGYDVYVAKNDRSINYGEKELGEGCIKNLNIAGFSDATLRIIEYVDVIWLEDNHIVQMFEVESTTSIYSGILRMTDFVVKVPNLAVNMNIVAPEDDEGKVRKEMSRPTFQHVLDRSKHSTLNYLSFDKVRERRKIVSEAGPLQKVF